MNVIRSRIAGLGSWLSQAAIKGLVRNMSWNKIVRRLVNDCGPNKRGQQGVRFSREEMNQARTYALWGIRVLNEALKS